MTPDVTPPAGQSPAGGADPAAELRAAIDSVRVALMTFREHPALHTLPPSLLAEFAADLAKIEQSVGFARARITRLRQDAAR